MRAWHAALAKLGDKNRGRSRFNPAPEEYCEAVCDMLDAHIANIMDDIQRLRGRIEALEREAQDKDGH